MTIGVTNRVKLGIVREATPGTTPASPAFYVQRYTGTTLQGAPQTKVSEEIISDRQIGDLILVGKDVGGDVSFEMSCGRHLDIDIEAALFGAWAKTSEKDNNITAASITAVAATTYTTTAASPAWQQDDVVLATGFTNAANNKTFVAGAATSSTSIVHTSGVVETPSTTARLKKVGLQARTAADIQATTSGGNALTSTSMNFTLHGLAVGQWVKIGDSVTAANSFANAANNGWARISAIAATRLSFDIVPAGFTTDTAAGKTIRIYFGDYVRNGTTQYAHTIEEQFLDIVQYQYFKGMVVAQLTLEAESQDLLKGSVTFLGMDNTLTGSTRVAGATEIPAAPSEVLNAAANVARIAENGTALTSAGNFVTRARVQVNNNLREQNGLGVVGAAGIGAGRAEVTGSVTAYFADNTLLAKVLANTASSIDFVSADALGNGYLVDIPKVKFATGGAPVPGVDQDIVQELNFQGLKHATLGYTLHIQKVEGAV